MKLIYTGRTDDTVTANRSAVTIGAYDGVHRGHQTVIAAVNEYAKQRNLLSAVVTFDRHPASVVRPDSAPPLLCDLDQKLELLEATGIDIVVVVRFDEQRSLETAEDFVTNVLVDQLNAKAVMVGEDFHFGHRRAGNVPLLKELGDKHDFEVAGLALVGVAGKAARDHEQVSSTAIRRALAIGDLGTANVMLTRPFEVRGTVVTGDKRGRELGFPTANITVSDEMLLPADGVYAGWYVRPDGSCHGTAISLGTRPHFYDEHGARLLEAHLLDFDEDLYGEEAKVRFIGLLRQQRKFESLDELVNQLGQDVSSTRDILGL